MIRAALLVVGAGAVLAQAPAPRPIDMNQLQRWADDRGAALPRGPALPRPVGGVYAPEQTFPLPVPMTCMAIDPHEQVYSRPDANALVLGYTQPQIAVIAQREDYSQVWYYNGKVGYVSTSSLRPWESKVKPGVKCTVTGLRGSGAPLFDFR